MDISYHKLYLYDHVFQLLMVDGYLCLQKDNGPMNKQPLKAHRGIDNRLIFRVLNPDRIPVDVAFNKQVYARIIDPSNNTIVLEKLCRLGPAKGIINLELDAGDLALVNPGLFSMVLISTEDFIVGVSDYTMEKPLYTDLNDNISMEIEITEQAFKAPIPSITLNPEDWTPDILIGIMTPPQPCFYSQRIPGARVQNHINSVHSFSTYTENFTGILEVWGSLEETPDPYLSETRWFKIYPSTMSQDITYTGYTGTESWTFTENCMWIKFRYFPSTDVLDPGVMRKLIVRT